MTDEEFFELIEEKGIDEACRLLIVEAWQDLSEELWEKSLAELN